MINHSWNVDVSENYLLEQSRKVEELTNYWRQVKDKKDKLDQIERIINSYKDIKNDLESDESLHQNSDNDILINCLRDNITAMIEGLRVATVTVKRDITSLLDTMSQLLWG